MLNPVDIFRILGKFNCGPLRGQVKSRYFSERIDGRRQYVYFSYKFPGRIGSKRLNLLDTKNTQLWYKQHRHLFFHILYISDLEKLDLIVLLHLIGFDLINVIVLNLRGNSKNLSYFFWLINLTLSRPRPISYRNQSIDLQRK